MLALGMQQQTDLGLAPHGACILEQEIDKDTHPSFHHDQRFVRGTVDNCGDSQEGTYQFGEGEGTRNGFRE